MDDSAALITARGPPPPPPRPAPAAEAVAAADSEPQGRLFRVADARRAAEELNTFARGSCIGDDYRFGCVARPLGSPPRCAPIIEWANVRVCAADAATESSSAG